MTKDELLAYYLKEFEALARHAEIDGFVVTITQRSIEPLAMRNYETIVEVREKR